MAACWHKNVAWRSFFSRMQTISAQNFCMSRKLPLCILKSTTQKTFSNGVVSSIGQSKCVEEDSVTVLGEKYTRDEMTNVTESLLKKADRKLHQKIDHPLGIIKRRIQDHMHGRYRSRYGGCIFAAVDNLSPVVTIEQNFDSLLVPKDHVSRLKNDNYYINKDCMLRAHTSAHQRDIIKSGWDAFLITGDVYRRDEIDKSHYPVFHQMEGVRVFGQNDLFSQHPTVRLLHHFYALFFRDDESDVDDKDNNDYDDESDVDDEDSNHYDDESDVDDKWLWWWTWCWW